MCDSDDTAGTVDAPQTAVITKSELMFIRDQNDAEIADISNQVKRHIRALQATGIKDRSVTMLAMDFQRILMGDTGCACADE